MELTDAAVLVTHPAGNVAAMLAHGGYRQLSSPTSLRSAPTTFVSDVVVEVVDTSNRRLRKVLKMPIAAARAGHVMLCIGCSASVDRMHISALLLGGSGPRGFCGGSKGLYAATFSITVEFLAGLPVDAALHCFHVLQTSGVSVAAIHASNSLFHNACVVRKRLLIAECDKSSRLSLYLLRETAIARSAVVALPATPLVHPLLLVHVPALLNAGGGGVITKLVVASQRRSQSHILYVEIEGTHLLSSRLIECSWTCSNLRCMPFPTDSGHALMFGEESVVVDITGALCPVDSSHSRIAVPKLHFLVGASQCTMFLYDTTRVSLVVVPLQFLEPPEHVQADNVDADEDAQGLRTQQHTARGVGRSPPRLCGDVWFHIAQYVSDLGTLALLSRTCKTLYHELLRSEAWSNLVMGILDIGSPISASNVSGDVWRAAAHLLSRRVPRLPLRLFVSAAAQSGTLVARSPSGTFVVSDACSLKVVTIPRGQFGPCRSEILLPSTGYSFAAVSGDGRMVALSMRHPIEVSRFGVLMWMEGATGWERTAMEPMVLPFLPDALHVLPLSLVDGESQSCVVAVHFSSGQALKMFDDGRVVRLNGGPLPPIQAQIHSQSEHNLPPFLLFATAGGVVVRLCLTHFSWDLLPCHRARYVLFDSSEQGVLLLSRQLLSYVQLVPLNSIAATSWAAPADKSCLAAVLLHRHDTAAILVRTHVRSHQSDERILLLVQLSTSATLWSSTVPSSGRALLRMPLVNSVILFGPDAAILYHWDASTRSDATVLHASDVAVLPCATSEYTLVRTCAAVPVFALCSWDGTSLVAIPLWRV